MKNKVKTTELYQLAFQYEEKESEIKAELNADELQDEDNSDMPFYGTGNQYTGVQKTFIFNTISRDIQKIPSRNSQILTNTYRKAANLNYVKASKLIAKIENSLPPAIDWDTPVFENVNPGRYYRMDD